MQAETTVRAGLRSRIMLGGVQKIDNLQNQRVIYVIRGVNASVYEHGPLTLQLVEQAYQQIDRTSVRSPTKTTIDHIALSRHLYARGSPPRPPFEQHSVAAKTRKRGLQPSLL